jgi:hypothetical protein
MNKKVEAVLKHIYEIPRTTQATIIKRFGDQFFNTTSRYGSQRLVSTIIARLRRDKLVEDVPRCSTCGCAQGRKPHTELTRRRKVGGTSRR